MLVGVGEKIRIVGGVGRIDEAFVGELDMVGERVNIVDAADAHTQETEEVGGFRPEVFGAFEGGEKQEVGFDNVLADFVFFKGGRHGGKVVVTVKTFADGGFFAFKELVVVTTFETILGLIIEAGERHVFDAVFDDTGEGKFVDRNAGIFTDVVEELDGNKLISDVGVVDGHGVTNHRKRVNNVGLTVAAGLAGMMLLHVTECT